MPPLDLTQFYKDLAHFVCGLITPGFTVDAAVDHFLISTYGADHSAAVAALLRDPAHHGAEDLLDLIVSPDYPRRLEMEAWLENAPSVPPEALESRHLSTFWPSGLETRLSFPDDRPAFFFPVPPGSITRFYAQFHLSSGLAPELCQAFARRWPRDKERQQARIYLRLSRARLTPERSRIIKRFCEKSTSLDPTSAFEGLRLLLSLCQRPPNETDFFDLLLAEKANCQKQITQSDQLARQLTQKNIETLLLQGQRGFLAVDKAKMYKKISLLDKLGLILFDQRPVLETMDAFSFENKPGP